MESNDKIKIILKDDDSLKFKLDNKIEKVSPPLENLEVNPSKEEQTFKSKDYYGYDEVKVNPVTNSIDENIKPENIKKDVSILGVIGNVEEINATEISINPISVEQTITPEAPYNGFSKVTVGAQSGINPDEYFENKITSSNSQYFFDGFYFLKKIYNEFYVNANSLSSSFYGYTLEEAPNLIGEGKVTNWYQFLRSAKKVKEIPQYDTSNGYNFNYAFYADSFENIALLDFSKAKNIANVLKPNSSNLKNIGGFKDLGKAYKTAQSANYYAYTLNLSGCNNLTHDSLMNVINNLYDIATAGVQPQQLQLGSTNLAKLTDEEKAIATNKGWSIS